MNFRAQLACAWSGIVAMTIMFIAIWPLMGFFPPFSPSLSATETAAIFRGNATGIIVGGMLQMLAMSIFMAFFAALALQMRRMESAPLWTIVMLTTTVMGFLLAIPAELMFAAAAYRPERSDEIIQAMSDYGFFLFIGPALPGTVQMLSVALGILGDKNPDPIFPRWVGYFSAWAAVLVTPGCLITLFKGGPFAWNGVLAFWVAAFALGIWVNVLFWAMRRAIHKQMRDGQ